MDLYQKIEALKYKQLCCRTWWQCCAPSRTCSGIPVDHRVQLLPQHCQGHPHPTSPSAISGATHQVTGIGLRAAGTDRDTAHWQWGWGFPEGLQCPFPSPWTSQVGWLLWRVQGK